MPPCLIVRPGRYGALCCDRKILPRNETGCRMPDVMNGSRLAGAADDVPQAEDETHLVCLERARRALAPAGWRIDDVTEE